MNEYSAVGASAIGGSRNRKLRVIRWAWVILAVCFFNLFVNFSVRLGYGVLLPEMVGHLGLTRTAAGSIFNAYLFVYLAFTPLAGLMTDRLGARRVITVCMLILGVGLSLMGTASGLSSACAFYAIAGLGASGLWTPVITVVQRWFASTHRGRALGILSTGYGLGFAVSGLLFPWIVREYGWREVWYVLGAAAFIMAVVNGFFLKSNPESMGAFPWGSKEGPSPIAPDKSQVCEVSFSEGVLKEQTFWLIGFSYLFISYCLYGITTFMVDYGRYEAGLSPAKAGLLATVHGVCQVAGVLTILPLSDYLGRKKTILLSNFGVMAAIAGILSVGPGMPSAFFVCVGIMAVFYGVTFPIYGACAGDYFPAKWMGTVIGSWTPFYGLGAILAHWVGGVIRDASGSYSGAFAVNAAAAGIAFLLIVAVKRRKKI